MEEEVTGYLFQKKRLFVQPLQGLKSKTLLNTCRPVVQGGAGLLAPKLVWN